MYREIVETSPDGVWVVDLDGRTLYANPAMARQLGRTRAEMATLSMYDVHDDLGRRQLADHFAELRRGRPNPEPVECLFLRKDGSVTWVLLSETLRPADADGPARVVLHTIEWTERRRLLDTLSRQRVALAEAERIARIGSWRYDPTTDVYWCSDGLRAALGMDAGAAPASREEFLRLVHPEDVGRLVDESAAAYAEGSSFEVEARMATPSGWRWFAGCGRAGHDPDGTLVRTGTFQDIHERREAQQALQEAVIQNGLMQATAAAANQAQTFDEVLRMSQQLIASHDAWKRGRVYVPDEDGGSLEPHWLRQEDRLEDAGLPDLVEAELELAHRVCRSRDVEWSERPAGRHSLGFPVVHQDQVVAVVVIGEQQPFQRPDLIASMASQAAVQLAHVVERERTAQQLAAARDAAMEGSRQKSEFLATMSHEIRTPLNGVIGLNDLLLTTDLDAEQRRLATGVQVSSRSLLGLINDVLDFSKIEAGRLDLEEIDFEVRAVLDQVAAVLGESARARGLSLVVRCRPDVPAVLRGDPTRLAQVLTNLGSNAVKFTEEGQVSVEARVEPTAGGGEHDVLLRLEVVDSGVGIEPELRDLIFHRFVQADASTTRRYGGTGLGLAISRQIVEAFGGEMGVDSTPGQGSRFWFTVPMRVAGGSSAPTTDEAPSVAARSEDGSRPRVLVVEDNPVNQMVTTGMLELLGYDCDTVDDGLAAVHAVRRVHDSAGSVPRYDAVLMDLRMPRLDGVEATRAIRDLESEAGAGRTPVIAMTASAVSGERERCLEAGMDDFLTKPVTPGALGALVGRWVAQRPGGAPAGGGTDRATTPGRGPAVPEVDVPEVDTARLEVLRDLAEDRTYLDRVIARFLTHSRRLVAQVAAAVEAGDSQALRRAAHSLRGSATNLGLVRLGEQATELEECGGAGDLDRARELVPALEAAVERGRSVLLDYRAGRGD